MKHVVVVIPLLKKIRVIGDFDSNLRSKVPFDNLVCAFLNKLSIEISHYKKIREYPDLKAFSFWIRKKNIEIFKNKYDDENYRLGKGILFHVTPSSIPMNFAYSFVFGLLSGNLNIIRIPSKNFFQINIFLKILDKVLNLKKYRQIKRMNLFIRYSKDKKINDYLSLLCDVRIIWGGNNSINEIRQSNLKPKAFDLTFYDRYSIALINSNIVNNLQSNDLKILANHFYNDTYYIDQNACSSPHLIIWVGKNITKAKNYFWGEVNSLVNSKYIFEEAAIVDKYSLLLKNLTKLKNISSLNTNNSKLYRISIDKIDNFDNSVRGKWGMFFEYESDNINFLKKIVESNFQTLSYFGFNKNYLKDYIISNSLRGIDRIVPIGQTLSMDLVWDGYDIIKILSRKINFK